MKPRSALWGAFFALVLASCSLFETTITRDLRVAWSPDGTSLLVVTSEYATTDPSEIYFNATMATHWRVKLDTADGTAASPLKTRQLLDEFDEFEGPGQGGVAQYEPVYWFPKLSTVVFGGRTGAVRFTDTKSTWKPQPPRAELAGALGTVTEIEPTLTATQVAADLELQDLVPSPDGTTLAGLYAISYLWGPEIGGEFYEYRVIAFWDVATQTLLAAKRVTPEIWHTQKPVDPYPELAGDDDNYVMLSWKPDATGVYAYVPGGYDGSVLTGEHPSVPGLVAFVPLTGTAATATQVPSRPVPTSSGPVSPSGVGYYLVNDGNKATLTPKTIPGWVPFDQIPVESFSAWTAHSAEYNFGD